MLFSYPPHCWNVLYANLSAEFLAASEWLWTYCIFSSSDIWASSLFPGWDLRTSLTQGCLRPETESACWICTSKHYLSLVFFGWPAIVNFNIQNKIKHLFYVFKENNKNAVWTYWFYVDSKSLFFRNNYFMLSLI